MPRISGKEIVIDEKDKFHMVCVQFNNERNSWISLSDWLGDKIAWIDKTENDLPYGFDIYTYKNIINRVNSLNRTHKNVLNTFQSYFVEEEIEYKGEMRKIWKIADSKNPQIVHDIYSILKQIQYYDLSLYSFIKEIADARGAHIDSGMMPIVAIVNKSIIPGYSAIAIFAIQMIVVACQQIPELSDYLQEPWETEYGGLL